MRVRWNILIVAGLALALSAAADLATAAGAQGRRDDKDRETQLRTVKGKVIDKDENPVASGVVYLKNVKTRTVKTYISEDDGSYRFSGLDPNVDYEVHAEHGDRASSKRTVSSFDSRKEIVIHLKLDKKKDE